VQLLELEFQSVFKTLSRVWRGVAAIDTCRTQLVTATSFRCMHMLAHVYMFEFEIGARSSMQMLDPDRIHTTLQLKNTCKPARHAQLYRKGALASSRELRWRPERRALGLSPEKIPGGCSSRSPGQRM
jgi:hypothetical protein